MIWLLGLTMHALAQDSSTAFLRKIEKKFLPPPRFGEELPQHVWRLDKRPAAPTINDIVRSPVVQKAVRYRGRLQDLRSEEFAISLERKIVNTYSLADEQGYFYILGKDNLPSHRVHMNEVVDIKADVAMYEEPRQYTPVIIKQNVSPYDRVLRWQPELSLLVGRSSSDWTADLLDDTQALHTTGIHVAGRWMADFNQKFWLGAVVQFEGAQYNLRAGDASYRNYSFGMIARTPDYNWGGFPWRVSGEFLYGPIGVLSLRTDGQTRDIYLRTSSTVLSWEKIEKNALGQWAWGLSWQRDWPKLRNQQDYVRLDSASSTNDMVGLHLTQGFAW